MQATLVACSWSTVSSGHLTEFGIKLVPPGGSLAQALSNTMVPEVGG
jgi:hypothetical protein